MVWGGILVYADNPELLPFAMLGVVLDEARGSSRNLLNQHNNQDKDHENSLFKGLPIDRHFAVKSLARTQRLVKAK